MVRMLACKGFSCHPNTRGFEKDRTHNFFNEPLLSIYERFERRIFEMNYDDAVLWSLNAMTESVNEVG